EEASKLAAQFPEVHAYRREVASAQVSLGDVAHAANRLQDAATHYRDAVGLLTTLVAQSPNPHYRQALARTHEKLARVLQGMRKRRLAEEQFQQALGLFEKLVTDCPEVPGYRTSLAGALGNFAQMLRADPKQLPRARELLERAIQQQCQVLDAVQTPRYRMA